MKHEVSDASFGHRLHIWHLNTEVGRPERHASLGCTHPVEKISQGLLLQGEVTVPSLHCCTDILAQFVTHN